MLLFGHSYAGSTDGGGDDFIQRGVADHDFMQSFGRIAADHEQLGHGDEVGYAVADGRDARDGVTGHTTFTNPPEARLPARWDSGSGGPAIRLRDFPGGKEPFGGLADAHDLGAAVNADGTGPGHVYAFFVSEDAAATYAP